MQLVDCCCRTLCTDTRFCAGGGDLFDLCGQIADQLGDGIELAARLFDVRDVLFHRHLLFLREVECGLDLCAVVADDAVDLLRCGLGFLRELAHLLGDDGKSAALLARARCLDGSIECEQLGLTGNVRDDLVDVGDALRPVIELAYGIAHMGRVLGEMLDAAHEIGQHIAALLRLRMGRLCDGGHVGDCLGNDLHLSRRILCLCRGILDDAALLCRLFGDVDDGGCGRLGCRCRG